MTQQVRGYEIDQAKVKISLASDCNLNCLYCSKKGTIGEDCKRSITTAEILAICEALYSKGYRHAYLGGGGYGEPLLAKDAVSLSKGLKKLGYKNITLVTNGTLLKGKCEEYFKAGVTACNISLDTLDPRIYAWLSGKDLLPQVIEGVEEAVSYFDRVKVITVLLNNINDVEIFDLIEFCKKAKIELQINDLVNLEPESNFYDTHYLDPTYLIETLDKTSPHVEIIKRDSKHKFHFGDFSISVRITKAFSNFAIREDSPIIRPDGKLVWLSHENTIFDIKKFLEKKTLKSKKALENGISKAIDNRLKNVTSEMIHQISICGSFSRAAW